MTHTFAVMWDCYGLEAVTCVSDIEQKIMWETLKTGKKPREIQMPNLMHWQLRAQANPQRNYEIYIITAVDGIGVDDIRGMFEASPQVAADTIRRLGHEFYSDRESNKRVIV